VEAAYGRLIGRPINSGRRCVAWVLVVVDAGVVLGGAGVVSVGCSVAGVASCGGVTAAVVAVGGCGSSGGAGVVKSMGKLGRICSCWFS
jgi:hypothetical protein